MDADPFSLGLQATSLVNLGESNSSHFINTPECWSATEALTSPDIMIRRAGLDRLVEMDVLRISPLVAYVAATRLADPDLVLRTRLVRLLGELLRNVNGSQRVLPEVHQRLSEYLSDMRTRSVFALLQVTAEDENTRSLAAVLLGCSSFAGSHMADILLDREAPLSIRREAVYFIQQIGYLDAIPVLERLISRLQNRAGGQLSLPGIRIEEDSELNLLPALQTALSALKAP